MRFVSFSLAMMFAFITLGSASANPSQMLSGAYLGQKVPSNEAEVFGPGVISKKLYSYGGTFSPDMQSFYFLRQPAEDAKVEFVVMHQQEGQWQESLFDSKLGQPMFSPDGNLMHLGKRVRTRTPEGWSDAISVGEAFEDFQIMRMSSSLQGTYVFDEAGWPDGDGVIRYSRLIDGVRHPPKAFPKHINTGTFNAHPFIAPDESYLLWDGKREHGFGGSDIYISFRQEDGTWGKAINMGKDINTNGWDAAASVTPDGKYLFFHRLNEHGNANMYWVSAQVIETLRTVK
ncbi:MAG: PD40 domain-containing protein [Gammaproteobacteria bacterium]|nr:PD40 domain-containing protein [Gammaproteobacteria bacterium]